MREQVILEAVNRLLAQKGYDAMTVDEVAAAAGLTKPSLYKHFASKEALAGAALNWLLDEAVAVARAQPDEATPLARLRSVLRWALAQHLAGAMPLLPATRSSLREALLKDTHYVERLNTLSALLTGWIEHAQQAHQIDPALPADVVLFTLYARSCDPVLDFLRDGGQYDEARVLDLVLATCFDGLRPRALP